MQISYKLKYDMRHIIFIILTLTLTVSKSQTPSGTITTHKCEIQDTISKTYGDFLISMTLNKECYRYTVKITNQKTKKSLNIPNQLQCVYFSKVENDVILFDFGTSLTRLEYFYDLKQEKIIDSMCICACCLDSVVRHPDKCNFALILSEKKVKELKLPKCETIPMEFNGYTEEVYYDFQLKKIIHTGRYKCT